MGHGRGFVDFVAVHALCALVEMNLGALFAKIKLEINILTNKIRNR